MLFNEKEKEIVRKALKDYDFIKEEIDNRIKQNYDLNDLHKFLLEFKHIDITNIEIKDDYGYLDFMYNDLNMYVGYDNGLGICNDELENHKIRVSNTFEIYNKEKCEYIIEDFCTKEEYQKYLENTKEKELQNRIDKLKYLEEKNLMSDYKAQSLYIIDFLKNNW